MIGQLPSPKSCEHNRRIYSDGTVWEHECNSCKCDNGKVRCTKVSVTPFFLSVFLSVFSCFFCFFLPFFFLLSILSASLLSFFLSSSLPCFLSVLESGSPTPLFFFRLLFGLSVCVSLLCACLICLFVCPSFPFFLSACLSFLIALCYIVSSERIRASTCHGKSPNPLLSLVVNTSLWLTRPPPTLVRVLVCSSLSQPVSHLISCA